MADLLWSNVVGNKTIEAGGYVGDLLTTARAHVDQAVIDNRLTQAQAGEVYTAMIPAAFQSALEFALRENLVEAQIAETEASTALKIAQLGMERDKTEAELEKQWGYAVTRDVDGNLVLGDSTGTGVIDKQAINLDEDKETSDKNQLILDKQLLDVIKTTDIKERDMAEKEATGAKQRILLDEEKETSDLNQILLATEETIKEAQLLDIVKSTEIKERSTVVQETELQDKIATSEKQRILLDTEEQAKQYEVDNLLPEQLNKLKEEVDMLQTEEAVKAYQKDNILPREKELLEGQIADIDTQKDLKLLATQLGTWGNLFSNSKITTSTAVIEKAEIDGVYTRLDV